MLLVGLTKPGRSVGEGSDKIAPGLLGWGSGVGSATLHH